MNQTYLETEDELNRRTLGQRVIDGEVDKVEVEHPQKHHVKQYSDDWATLHLSKIYRKTLS